MSKGDARRAVCGRTHYDADRVWALINALDRLAEDDWLPAEEGTLAQTLRRYFEEEYAKIKAGRWW